MPRIGADVSRLEWSDASTRDLSGDAQFDLADMFPVLWGETDIPLWQVDLVQGAGPHGEDVVNALLAGGQRHRPGERDARRSSRSVMRVRPVPFQDLRRRVGVGLERPEQRVLLRSSI